MYDLPVMRKRTQRLSLLILILLLAGCGTETAVSPANPPAGPTVAPAPTLAPTASASTATATATATAAPPPTIAPPTPPPTPPPEEAPTAMIPGLIGPGPLPPDVNPLTGETVSNPAVLARRPIAIKISNAPPLVRPQAGLNSADLIFEHYAEGGYTRFTAVFYSRDADPVGSVRSGRIIDFEIPVMYDAAFAYSGSVGLNRLRFRDSSFFERIISQDFAHGGFYRVPDPNKPVEHTLFTDTYTLRAILEARGQNGPPVLQSQMAFRTEPLSPGAPVSRLELRYRATNATWVYNAGAGRYQRWTDGEPHLDANSGAQLSFKNIVVVAANHVETDILEDTVGGGNYSLEIQIWGEGPVSIFRDGQRFDGRWRRSNPSHMLTFTDLEGNVLPLAPGNSFFQLAPLGFTDLYTTP
jgi:hypothetical protein